jgi:hypothetical protein
LIKLADWWLRMIRIKVLIVRLRIVLLGWWGNRRRSRLVVLIRMMILHRLGLLISRGGIVSGGWLVVIVIEMLISGHLRSAIGQSLRRGWKWSLRLGVRVPLLLRVRGRWVCGVTLSARLIQNALDGVLPRSNVRFPVLNYILKSDAWFLTHNRCKNSGYHLESIKSLDIHSGFLLLLNCCSLSLPMLK